MKQIKDQILNLYASDKIDALEVIEVAKLCLELTNTMKPSLWAKLNGKSLATAYTLREVIEIQGQKFVFDPD